MSMVLMNRRATSRRIILDLEGGASVIAHAQDGSGLNNANFYTPIDGMRPRMRMYLFEQSSPPQRDAAFENGIVVSFYFQESILNWWNELPLRM